MGKLMESKWITQWKNTYEDFGYSYNNIKVKFLIQIQNQSMHLINLSCCMISQGLSNKKPIFNQQLQSFIHFVGQIK